MRVHLVDGTYELFRAHYARTPEHLGADGRDVKATLGLVGSLLALLEDPAEAVTHLAVAFDNPIRSFRNDLYAGYKTEAGVPAGLLGQFDLAEEATAALGVVVWSMDRHEADDALATGAARFAGRVEQVRILTPDKDLGQCLERERVVQVDRVRGADRLAQTLRERRDEARLYRRLATLVRDVPLAGSLDDLAWRGALEAPFRALCDRLAAPRLTQRPRRWA